MKILALLRQPLGTLRITVRKLIIQFLSKKHANSQQFVTSLPGYPGRYVPRSVPSGTTENDLLLLVLDYSYYYY